MVLKGTVEKKDLEKAPCEALTMLEQALRAMGKHKLADEVRKIAIAKGCIIKL